MTISIRWSTSRCTRASTRARGSTWSWSGRASATPSRFLAASRRPSPRTSARTVPADLGMYLRVMAGEDVESGLDHFRTKAESINSDDGGTRPAEVYVNLLLHGGRTAEAATAARKLLATADERSLSCPGPLELTRRQ